MPDHLSSKLVSWPARIPADADIWKRAAYADQFSEAARDRLELARDKLIDIAAECAECHGKRCTDCEDIWQVIDQIEIPA